MKNLLYLEDDEALAGVTVRAMSKRGFDVNHFTSLSAVREEKRRNLFTHALLDLRLDDGNALELIKELTAQHDEIKILVLTGYASIASAVHAIKQGATNYLSKPATAEQIVKAFEDTEMEEPAIDDDHFSLKRMEWEHIQQALADNEGNISAAARQLKMHRRTLQRKLAKKPRVT